MLAPLAKMTLAVCFVGLENLIDTDALEMMEGACAEVAGVIAITKVAALASENSY